MTSKNESGKIQVSKTKKESKMNVLFTKLQKKTIDQFDEMLADDYISYYGIEPTEMAEYADEFVAVCYQYNEETGEHEPRMPDELPFAEESYPDDQTIKYTYGGCSVTKMRLGN